MSDENKEEPENETPPDGDNELAVDPDIPENKPPDDGDNSEEENLFDEDREADYELGVDEATDIKPQGALPKILERKKLLMYIIAFFSVIVIFGMISSGVKNKKKQQEAALAAEGQATQSERDFLLSLNNQAMRKQAELERLERERLEKEGLSEEEIEKELEKEPPKPPVPEVVIQKQDMPPPPPPTRQNPPPQQSGGGGGQQGNPNLSPLIPQVQGNLAQPGQGVTQRQNLPAGARQEPGAAAGRQAELDAYYQQLMSRAETGRGQDMRQPDRANKNDFQNSRNLDTDAVYNGQYIGNNSLWTGTVVTGILETAINTDLPGNILARVTQNVFDSQTGTKLLVPQGTLLLARYNSSISYAQSRVQIIWDTMIRPDGFQIELGGAPGTDTAGMAGQPAKVSENWFAYAKALGIITMFSYANAKMTETAAGLSNDQTAAGNMATGNAEVVGQLGGSMMQRAMDIQPTLTVENGTVISIMLNKTLYLPPVGNTPPNQKYILN